MAACSHRAIARGLIVRGANAAGQVHCKVAAKQEFTRQRGVQQDGGRDAECRRSENKKQDSIDDHCHLKQYDTVQ